MKCQKWKYDAQYTMAMSTPYVTMTIYLLVEIEYPWEYIKVNELELNYCSKLSNQRGIEAQTFCFNLNLVEEQSFSINFSDDVLSLFQIGVTLGKTEL